MKMMDDDIEIDPRRKRRRPSLEPVVKLEVVVQSPAVEREERRTGAGASAGSFATSLNRGVGGSVAQAGGRSVPSSNGIQDPRGARNAVGTSVGHNGNSSSTPHATLASRGREEVVPSSL